MKTAVCLGGESGETAAIMRGKESSKKTEREREKERESEAIMRKKSILGVEGRMECEKCGERGGGGECLE